MGMWCSGAHLITLLLGGVGSTPVSKLRWFINLIIFHVVNRCRLDENALVAKVGSDAPVNDAGRISEFADAPKHLTMRREARLQDIQIVGSSPTKSIV